MKSRCDDGGIWVLGEGHTFSIFSPAAFFSLSPPRLLPLLLLLSLLLPRLLPIPLLLPSLALLPLLLLLLLLSLVLLLRVLPLPAPASEFTRFCVAGDWMLRAWYTVRYV